MLLEEKYAELDFNSFMHEAKAQGISKGRTEGEIRNACRVIGRGLYTVEDAAKDIGISPDEFRKRAKDLSLTIPSL